MPQKTLLTNPLCRAEDLGKPIPPTEHANSMCLPRWQDVVGYEEKNPETMAELNSGYPRFFYHPLVVKAFEKYRREQDECVQLYQTVAAANRARDFLLSLHPNARIECRSIDGYPAVTLSFPEVCDEDARAYWQHTGDGIFSRLAELMLRDEPLPDAAEAEREIKQRLADCAGVSPEQVYLFPCGMSAIYSVFRMYLELYSDRKTVQFAFPYADTLKLQEKLGAGALFYPRGDASELAQLEKDLEQNQIAGLFCEFPTNPLLACVDLPKLRALADEHNFPIMVDETLCACGNVDVLPYADISAISLTKYFTGTGDVMGGALIINPDSPFAVQFKELLEQMYEPDACCPASLIEIARVSKDVDQRVAIINQNAVKVCDYLKNHPQVERVYYSAYDESGVYDQLKRDNGGYGGLFSFVLKDAEKVTIPFYDALEISKGPNLGTLFSLCCPFILLAHYNELEWAEAAGASRYLIRISVGLEPADELIARFERAFEASKP